MKISQLALAFGLTTCVACGESETQSTHEKHGTASSLEQRYFRHRLYWERLPSDEAAIKIRNVAEVLNPEQPLSAAKVHADLQSVTDDKAFLSYKARSETSATLVAYERPHDSLRVKVPRTETLDDIDIGADAARAQYIEVVNRLVTRHLFALSDYLLAEARMAPTIDGRGINEKIVQQGTVEYGFSTLRALHGIPVENAYLSVRISRTGRPLSVRLGGIKIDPQEVPIDLPITSEEVRRRFEQEYPSSIVQSERVAYAVGENFTEGLVEPRYVIHFSTVEAVEGGTSISRQRILAYSLSRADAVPEELGPMPTPGRPGDVRRPEPEN